MELAAVIVAAISAIAASIAAWNARRGIQLSQRAFVYAEPAIKTEPTESDGGGGFLSERDSHVELRLFNDGPGTALDVRVRLETEAGDPIGDSAAPVRALGSGEALPPQDGQQGLVFALPDLSQPWAAVVRYREIGGAAWEVRNPRHPASLPLVQRRLRSSRWDRWRSSPIW
ncbi:MAG TPA: hypothetical protein VFT79_01190 [Solirubrobacterales bacterium]|nr:hypothetical protein [Solirubrobacterales bacterium]